MSSTRSATSWFVAERARLPEERVDERRLPVVDVGDDRDVAELGSGTGHATSVAAFSGASLASSRADADVPDRGVDELDRVECRQRLRARRSAVETWTRQPGFALA